MKKENDLLEETLCVAQRGYPEAYQFLLAEYEKNPQGYGPQTLYFLACLAGGAQLPEEALQWLKTAIAEKGWWYRPEVLEDDDLSALEDSPLFTSLKALSDQRYADAVAKGRAVFSWKGKTAENLFVALHGNTQNAQTARSDWEPLLAGPWQLETVQSAEPDGYGTFRWSYNTTSCLPVAEALRVVQREGYGAIVCGGFSAGCDTLLRAVTFAPVRCDVLVLQSPWIPVLQDYEDEILSAIRENNIRLKAFCGAEDEDCLPMANRLFEAARREGIPAELTIQKHCRHQFPEKPSALTDLL